MCRMLGIVASEATNFRFCLHHAPRSLSCLSRQHPDGWGIAVYESGSAAWSVQKRPACAGDDESFAQTALGSTGHSMVAHIRKRTVGPVGVLNTHPFHRGRWVFAHNGTIEDTSYLRERTSAKRLGEVAGTTDSELFFAFVLSAIDEASAAPAEVEAVLAGVAGVLRSSPAFAASNFLLSNGEELYAFRRGRSLFVLERHPGDEVRPSRKSPETGAVVDTPWTARRRAVLVASEALTDEPWREVGEGDLVAIQRRPDPTLQVIATGR